MRPCITALAFAAMAACTFMPPETAHAEKDFRLSLPYPAQAPAIAEPDSFFTCPAPPAAPVRDLFFTSVYAKDDPHRATINEKARAAYIEKTGSLRRFENRLLQISNDYLRTGDTARAGCVLKWLHDWAVEDALLGQANATGIAVRQWSLASFSSAYAQIRAAPLPGLERERVAVEKWLLKCAASVMADYPPDSEKNSKENNHLYWAAWAVTITGIAIDEPALYDWGMARAETSIRAQFTEEGALPLELARGTKALHYHVFSALPLVMLAEAGARNGDDLYNLRGGILRRFVARITEGMKNPAWFEKKAGAAQIPVSKLHPSHFAWVEPYNQRYPSPALASLLREYRPLFLRRTGGDMSLLYLP